jgi:hypothetical protein
MFNCGNCDYSTGKMNLLHQHQFFHRLSKKSIFKCFHCAGMQFSNYYSFKQHIYRNHKRIPKKKPHPNLKYQCKNCSFQSDNISATTNHAIDSHLLNNTIICFLCPKKLSSKSNYRQHIRRHHVTSFPNRSGATNLTNEEMISKVFDKNDNNQDILNPEPNPDADPDLQNNTYKNDENPESSLLLLFLKLKAKYAVTDQVIQFVYEEVKHIITMFSDETKKAIDSIISDGYQDLKLDYQFKLHRIMESFKLDSISSKYKRTKAFKANFGYISSQSIYLGKDEAHADCFYEYVPIRNSLKSLLDNQVIELVSEKKRSTDFVYSDYNDGSLYKNNSFLNDGTLKLELILFSDAYGTCNPLVATSLKHKINGFYYILGNLPAKFRSKIDDIQLISLCKDKYIKHFGWNKVCERLVEDLKLLEKDGIQISATLNIKGTVFAVAGDNLGSHALGGFVENFSKTHNFCRYCYYNKDLLKNKCEILEARRTPLNYFADVENKNVIENNKNGVKFNSILNELEYFHVCNPGLPPCLGHDLFHGTFSLDLQLVIKALIAETNLKMSFLNASLQKFITSFRNLKKFPKLNEKHSKIRASMSEIYNIIILFPYILLNYSFNYEEDNLFAFLMTMVKITRYVTAPTISKDQVTLLRSEITEYFKLRALLFPGVNLLPKHHFLMHYPELILLFGPLSKFWTLRFESKHQYFINIMEHAKNFINENKMMAERHQLLQASLKDNRFNKSITSNSAKLLDPDMFNIDLPEKYIFCTKSVSFNNVRFGEQDYVVYNYNTDSQTFKIMLINTIFIDKNYQNLIFSGTTVDMFYNYQTDLYDAKFEDFSTKFCTVNGEDLLITKPVNAYQLNGKIYLSLPYTFPIIY